MAGVYGVPSEDWIFHEIAELLNTYNKLRVHHTYLSIKSLPVIYLVEIMKPYNWANHKVCGCVGVFRYDNTARVQHLSISSIARRRGIGRKLVKSALHLCGGYETIAMIRKDNFESQGLFKSIGFELTETINDLYLARRI